MGELIEGGGYEVDGVSFGLWMPTITAEALKDHYLTLNPVMLTKQEVEEVKGLIRQVKEEGDN